MEDSCGHLIQFKAEALTAPGLGLLLKQRLWQDLGAIVFEEKQEVMQHLIQYLHLIDRQGTHANPLAKQSTQHLLQAFLYELLTHQNLLEGGATSDQEFATFSRLSRPTTKPNTP